MRTRITRTAALLGGAALVAGSVLIASPAQAHDYVVSSTPAEGAVVTELPADFAVTMNENVLDISGDGTGFGIQVTDAAGLFYGDGCVTVSGASVSMPATLGEAGEYSLVWQVVSSDGHPTNGEYSFTWQPGSGAEAAAGSSAPPVCGEAVTEEETAAPVEPSAEPSPTAPAGEAQAGEFDGLLWGGIAVGVVAVAAAAALLITRRRKQD